MEETIKVKDLMKEWKKQLKEKGLWDKELYLSHNSWDIESTESLLITVDQPRMDGKQDIAWVKIGFKKFKNQVKIFTRFEER